MFKRRGIFGKVRSVARTVKWVVDHPSEAWDALEGASMSARRAAPEDVMDWVLHGFKRRGESPASAVRASDWN